MRNAYSTELEYEVMMDSTDFPDEITEEMVLDALNGEQDEYDATYAAEVLLAESWFNLNSEQRMAIYNKRMDERQKEIERLQKEEEEKMKQKQFKIDLDKYQERWESFKVRRAEYEAAQWAKHEKAVALQNEKDVEEMLRSTVDTGLLDEEYEEQWLLYKKEEHERTELAKLAELAELAEQEEALQLELDKEYEREIDEMLREASIQAF